MLPSPRTKAAQITADLRTRKPPSQGCSGNTFDSLPCSGASAVPLSPDLASLVPVTNEQFDGFAGDGRTKDGALTMDRYTQHKIPQVLEVIMESRQSTSVLKVGLWLDFALTLLYGIELLFLPGMLATVGGGTIPDFSWLRWSGGILVAVAYGCFRAARHPEGRDLFVTMMIVMGFLNALGHVISLINRDYTGGLWMLWMPAALTTIFSLILIVGRARARQVLTPA